jgi:hypothetical protein
MLKEEFKDVKSQE